MFRAKDLWNHEWNPKKLSKCDLDQTSCNRMTECVIDDSVYDSQSTDFVTLLQYSPSALAKWDEEISALKALQNEKTYISSVPIHRFKCVKTLVFHTDCPSRIHAAVELFERTYNKDCLLHFHMYDGCAPEFQDFLNNVFDMNLPDEMIDRIRFFGSRDFVDYIPPDYLDRMHKCPRMLSSFTFDLNLSDIFDSFVALDPVFSNLQIDGNFGSSTQQLYRNQHIFNRTQPTIQELLDCLLFNSNLRFLKSVNHLLIDEQKQLEADDICGYAHAFQNLHRLDIMLSQYHGLETFDLSQLSVLEEVNLCLKNSGADIDGVVLPPTVIRIKFKVLDPFFRSKDVQIVVSSKYLEQITCTPIANFGHNFLFEVENLELYRLHVCNLLPPGQEFLITDQFQETHPNIVIRQITHDN